MSPGEEEEPPLPTVAVVAIARLENDYLEEWVRHHRRVGVSEFFVFCNAGLGEPGAAEALLPREDYPDCTVVPRPGRTQQLPAYQSFVSRHLRDSRADWFFFIDVDEFVVPVRHGCVRRLLREHGPPGGSLALNWRVFDANGHDRRPAGGVRESYTRSRWDRLVKCAVSRPALRGLVGPAGVHNITGSATCLSGAPVTGQSNERDETAVARINHYFCKSREELRAKCSRGRADTPLRRDFEHFSRHYLHDPAAEEDLTALAFL